MKKLLLALTLLLARCACAQTVTEPGLELPNVFQKTNTFANIIDSGLTAGTAAICPNGTNGTLTNTGCNTGGNPAFSALSTTGSNGTNTNSNPWTINPSSALGGSTPDFNVTGAASDTNTAAVANFDTPNGSQQNSFRVGNTGVSQFQVCWQPGPQGEVVFGSAVTCSNIYTTEYAKNVFQSQSAAHNLMRLWQGSSAQTGPLIEMNTATAAGTGFDFLQGWTGVTGTDTFHTGGTKTWNVRGDGTFFGHFIDSSLTPGTSPICPNGTGGVFTTVGCSGGGGGNVNSASINSNAYYVAATTIGGLAAPTTPNGVPQTVVSIPSGGAATAPQNALPGITGRVVSTASDTIASTDCNPQRIENIFAGASAETLPTATTLAVPNCIFKLAVPLTAPTTTLVTVTPTTWTVNGASTLPILSPGQSAVFTVDPNSATNWQADVVASPWVPFTATAALTAGQVVKIDSANNTAVVVAGTGDTGGGIPIGIVVNSPGIGGTALVAINGLTTLPILGTGTCTKGQFVIVDTTTSGRIKCTGTYTAGTIIGKITIAQASVGSAVGMLIQIQ
jgi:hypothetical protein